MKTVFSTIAFVFLFINTYCQEFKTHSNGLIYDNNTVSQLKFIVDSLNLKFKSCEIAETYYAIPQTKAICLSAKSGNIKQLKADLQNNISLEQLKVKYPNITLSEPQLIIANNYTNYDEEHITRIQSKTIGEGYDKSIELIPQINVQSVFKKGDWIIKHYEKSEYTNEHITAFFLMEDFKRNELKDEYAQMIQYSDCMIDTTSTKILKDAELGYTEMPKNYRRLSKKRKEALLEKMRRTKVIGMCSQDDSPRVHAVNIAMLSAETVNWEVFLKAHLDVMNDRFDRVSDGSYAWGARKTYLKELEVLDINTYDLLLGITLRIDNAHKNHYYGSVGRLGRAIAESENRDQFEYIMLSMIKDEELDDYNRFIIYYLYDNYQYYLNDAEDEKERAANFEKVKAHLKTIQSTLPKHLINNG